MDFLNSKRGELTTQQIVTMVILITSFIIILFLLFRLNLGETSDSEICHNSVVMRGSSTLPTESVSLNCHTQYICLTADGTCEGLTKPKVIKVESLRDVYSELADEMANCFWMFGERKVNYVGDDATHNNYCSICSQILFDDSLSEVEGVDGGDTISKDGLFNFMSHNKVEGKDYSYLQYMTGTNDVESLKKASLEAAKLEGVGTFGNITIGRQYFVVTGITSEIGNTWKIIGGVGTALGVVAGFTPLGWGVGAVVIGASVVAGVGGEEVMEGIGVEILSLTVEGNGVKNRFMVPTIVEVNSEKFKALNCEDVLTYS